MLARRFRCRYLVDRSRAVPTLLFVKHEVGGEGFKGVVHGAIVGALSNCRRIGRGLQFT